MSSDLPKFMICDFLVCISVVCSYTLSMEEGVLLDGENGCYEEGEDEEGVEERRGVFGGE